MAGQMKHQPSEGQGHWLGCIVSGRKNKLKKSMVMAIIIILYVTTCHILEKG